MPKGLKFSTNQFTLLADPDRYRDSLIYYI